MAQTVHHGLRRVDVPVAAAVAVGLLPLGECLVGERVLPAKIVPVVDRERERQDTRIGAISPISLSAGGQDEQPWLVNSSTTARGLTSATASPQTSEAANAVARISGTVMFCQ